MKKYNKVLIIHESELFINSIQKLLRNYKQFIFTSEKKELDIRKKIENGLCDIIIFGGSLFQTIGKNISKLYEKNYSHLNFIYIVNNSKEIEEIKKISNRNLYILSSPFRLESFIDLLIDISEKKEVRHNKYYNISNYKFNPNLKELENSRNSKIKLTEKETSILECLYLSGSNFLPREILLKKVWGYSSQVSTHTLETHIYRIRQKIEKDGGPKNFIVNDLGGYKLIS
ncbi:helix-turn-helix domain-containing protein [Alphaproteobacteria bacterium]|nr:helix-turn-helix domain-containing protein [Alphaproteobacteria bacterium]